MRAVAAIVFLNRRNLEGPYNMRAGPQFRERFRPENEICFDRRNIDLRRTVPERPARFT